MVRGEQLYLGPYQRIAPDTDRSQIEEDAVEIDERAFADMDVVAVIAVKGRADESGCIGTELAQSGAVCCVVAGTFGVEPVHQQRGAVAVGRQLLVARVEPFARQHLLFLAFHTSGIFYSNDCSSISLA